MVVTRDGAEEGRVPLDDVGVLLCNARGLTYSNSLMVELARRGAGVALCGADYLPAAWLWPVEGHHVQAMRMRRQIDAPLPLRKRLWQAVVKAKIRQQAVELSVMIASKLIRRNLTREDNQALIDDALQQVDTTRMQ